MDKYKRGIGFAAGNMMIKWNTMSDILNRNQFTLEEGETIDVFINFESILMNISKYKNLNGLINNHKQSFVLELESAVFNLIGHYKSYFQRMKCKCKVYMYYTSFDSDNHQMMIYNKFYREYYTNLYTQNPLYSKTGNLLKETIIPELKLISSYIQDCYFIETSSFDSSLTPKIVSDMSENKSVIVTNDMFDTMYMFEPDTAVMYIERSFNDMKILTSIDEVITHIFPGDSIFDLTVFRSQLHYQLLLAMKGNVIRNIKPANGVAYNRFIDVIKNKILGDVVLREVSSLDTVIDLFPKKYQMDIKSSFQTMSLDNQYLLLSESDRLMIESQLIDKIDNESLNVLNNRRFLEFPINLQLLL